MKNKIKIIQLILGIISIIMVVYCNRQMYPSQLSIFVLCTSSISFLVSLFVKPNQIQANHKDEQNLHLQK